MSVSSEVKRTLVKSPPELWSELGDIESLSQHLGGLEGIRITRAEPETTVEWEADGASGSVQLSPSGFGTKVVLSLTRELPEPAVPSGPEPAADIEPKPDHDLEPAPRLEPVQDPEPEPEPDPEATPDPEPAPLVASEPEHKPGFLARLFRRRRPESSVAGSVAEPDPTSETVSEIEPTVEPAPEPEVEPTAETEPKPMSEPQSEVSVDLASLEAAMAEQDEALLTAMLDRLGAAHHRPFSRG